MYICLEKEAVNAQKPLSLKDYMLKIFRRMNSAPHSKTSDLGVKNTQMIIYFEFAVCPKIYPRLANGWLTCGDDRKRHNKGDELEYECAAGFVSSDVPLRCICDESFPDNDNPAWNCGGVDFATTCKISMCYHTRYSCSSNHYCTIR